MNTPNVQRLKPLQSLLLMGLFVAIAAACSDSTNGESTVTKTNQSDLNVVLQLVLDHAELQQYFHPTLDGRVPVKVARSGALSEEPALEKFDQPVQYVDKEQFADDEYAAYIEFAAIELSEHEATVYFSYQVEGVGGEMSMEKDESSGQWRIKDASVYEQ